VFEGSGTTLTGADSVHESTVLRTREPSRECGVVASLPVSREGDQRQRSVFKSLAGTVLESRFG
jgi:hypothetical protein